MSQPKDLDPATGEFREEPPAPAGEPVPYDRERVTEWCRGIINGTEPPRLPAGDVARAFLAADAALLEAERFAKAQRAAALREAVDAWDQDREKLPPEAAAFVHQWLRARADEIEGKG